jgi:branched-chain amino acid transport system substrate-binding protein
MIYGLSMVANFRKNLAISAILAVSTAFSASLSAAPTLKVGIYLPMSGGTATFGADVYAGMKIAIDEINKAGKVKIQAVLEDEKSEPTDAANAVKKLINIDKVNIVLGSVASSNTNAAAPIAQAAKIPLMTPASTNPNVTKNGDYISRICFIDDFQGAALAKFAKEELKATKAAIVLDSASDYSQGLAAAFRKAFKAGGGTIVTEVSYQAKDQDFSSQLTKIRTKSPEVIFVPGYYTEVGNMMRQAAKLKVKGVFMGGDGWSSSKLAELAGDAIEGHYYSAHFSHEDTDPAVQGFVKKFKALNKTAPSDMSALGYDAIYFAADVFKRNGFKTDAEGLKNAINSTKNYPGITGSITLDAERNATKPLVILSTHKGGDKFKQRVQP